MRSSSIGATIASALVNTLVPKSCACGAAGVHVCQTCAASLYGDPIRVDSTCAALCVARAVPGSLEGVVEPLMPVYALGVYGGALKGIVLDYKNAGHFAVAPLLAERMCAALDTLSCRAAHPHMLVATPSRMSAVRRRGEAHVLVLARHMAQLTSMPVMPGLRLIGASQRSRTRRERVQHSRIITTVRPAWLRSHSIRHAILIDDVVTTGSTLRTLHEFLERHRITSCAAITIAAARTGSHASVPSGTEVPHQR